MKVADNKYSLNVFEQSNSELVAIMLQQGLEGELSLISSLRALVGNAKDNPNSEDSKKIMQLIQDIIKKCEQGIKINDSNSLTLRGLLYKEGFGSEVNYKEAIRLIDQAINMNNATAMSYRGLMHAMGIGGEKNYVEAIRLLDQAIELKNDIAISNRALLHLNGLGGEKNYVEAIRLLDQAIELQNPNAIFTRAFMHCHGLGGDINFIEAIRLYKQASELGFVNALTGRAVLHLPEAGGNVNYKKAHYLLEHASKLGDVVALHNLGIVYNEGLGCDINYAQSILFLERAIRRGSTEALVYRRQRVEVDDVKVAHELVTLMWDDLIRGASLTQETLDLLSKHCKAEIINKISSSSLSTSLTFLHNLKTNQEHPITKILGYKTEEFNQLMNLAKLIIGQRSAFFQALRQKNEHPFFQLPAEVFDKILSFTDSENIEESCNKNRQA